jgi:membrane dipeptidase
MDKRSKLIKLSKDQEEHAEHLHKEAVIVDSCSLSYTLERKYFDRLKVGGIDVALISCGGLDDLSRKYFEIDQKPDEVKLCLTFEELEKSVRKERIAVFFGTQSCDVIGKNLGLLRIFHKLGYRSFGPTYSFGNLLGAGCIERHDYGLTYFGVDVIDELNRLNCLVDVSHCGDLVTDESIQFARLPVATHSNSRTLSNTKRNKTDEQIKAIAEKGGVVGCVAAPNFVAKPNPAAARKKWPTTFDFIDHIEHMIDLVGINHVGIGLDLVEKLTENGFSSLDKKDMFGMYRQRTLPSPSEQFGPIQDAMTIPYAIPSVIKLPDLTRGLVFKGYSDAEIKKILGENWLGIFKKIL